MRSLTEFLQGKLAAREKQGLIRKLTTTRLPIDFFSNDYLGLARCGDLFDNIEKLNHELGPRNGSTGSRLLGGNSPFTEKVESDLTRIFRSEACLIFNSGYAANLSVLSALPGKGDTIIYDNLVHASLKDGARLSLAARHSFRHNDAGDLEKKLKAAVGRKFIVVESIYSMDGDECPLREIVDLAQRYDATIILDEAHSTGVRGPGGAGSAIDQALHDKVDIRIYTFGKAMGVHGACVAGSEALIRYLVNFARPFIYTTALSQHQIVAIHCAFEYLSAHLPLQKILRDRIDLYLKGAAQLPCRTLSSSAIQTVICPGPDKVRKVAGALQQRGFDVRPILYPTVPEGTERLRICLHTYNTPEEISALTENLRSLLGDTA